MTSRSIKNSAYRTKQGKAGQDRQLYRAFSWANTNRRPAQWAVREGHCKYTENPSSLVLSHLPSSGIPHRSIEGTFRPTAGLYLAKGSFLFLPSDLHGQGKISVEMHVGTSALKQPKEDQCLLTARDQPPKQVHFPLTLPCGCSWTERAHITSSKPQPGIRKAIAHCAIAVSTDTLHYPEKSLRQADTFSTQGPCLPRELLPDQLASPHGHTVAPPQKTETFFGRPQSLVANRGHITETIFGDILRERQRLFVHGMVSLLLNFLLNFYWIYLMNFKWTFYEFLNVFEMDCIDFNFVQMSNWTGTRV